MNELITMVDEKPVLENKMVMNLINIQTKIKELKEQEENYKKIIKE